MKVLELTPKAVSYTAIRRESGDVHELSELLESRGIKFRFYGFDETDEYNESAMWLILHRSGKRPFTVSHGEWFLIDNSSNAPVRYEEFLDRLLGEK